MVHDWEKDDFVEKMSEAFTDAETISKSFLKQAIERSVDVDVNPVLMLTMVRVLCDLAIEDHKERFEKEYPLAELLKKDFDVFKELEDLVSVTIRGAYTDFKKEQSS